jgi:hypothetical protein
MKKLRCGERRKIQAPSPVLIGSWLILKASWLESPSHQQHGKEREKGVIPMSRKNYKNS